MSTASATSKGEKNQQYTIMLNDNPTSRSPNNVTHLANALNHDSTEGDGDKNTGDTSIAPQPYVSDGNMNVQQTNDNENESNNRPKSSTLEAPDEPEMANLYRDGTDRDWNKDDMADLEQEMKKQMSSMTQKTKKSSALSLPQPNLYREHTESTWDESDMEDLGEEMEMQIEHLKQQSGSLEQIQATDSVYHRIMMDGDTKSWSKSETTNTDSNLVQSNDQTIDK